MNNQWTERQKNIFEGLSSIGKEIAGFYEAGLKIYSSDFPNGAYFLLHAAREIDCGLRDILDVDYSPIEKEQSKHKKSILSSLGFHDFDGLAKDWHKATKNLHKYAHRHGAWKLPRKIQEVQPIWEQFESILERLVGSYYAIIERIERIEKIGNLKEGVIETLCNLLAIPAYYNYFFRKEKDIKWFAPLKNKHFFSADEIEFDNNGNTQFWNALDYLERVSEQISQNQKYGKELIDILGSLVEYSEQNKRINNYHIWWYCAKILNNIPTEIIKKTLPDKDFRKWLMTWLENTVGVGLIVSEIGEKLLPKFLNNNSTLSYAKNIIDIITQIKKGQEPPDLLLKNRNAVMKWDSYWVLDTFKKNSTIIGEKGSLNVIQGLAKRLNESLEYKRQDTYIDIDVGKDVYRIEIARVQQDGLKDNEIGFKDGEYAFLIKQFTPEQVQGIDRKDDFWTLHSIDPKEIKLPKTNFSAHNKSTFVSEMKEHLPQDIDWKSTKDLDEKIGGIFDSLYSDHSRIWFNSLAVGREHSVYQAEDILTTILSDVLLAMCGKNVDKGKQVLKTFLSDKYRFPIFKRFVLLCIDKHWEEYEEYFNKFLELIPDVLEKSDFEVELFDILEHHNSDFDDGLKARLKDIINTVPEYYVEKGERAAIYWKYKWFSPLRENPDFAGLYKEAKQKYKPKIGKHYEPKKMSFELIQEGHNSPLSKENILQMAVPELVKRFKKFKGPEFSNDDKPDKEGLAGVFQSAVKEDPKHFTDEIDVFIQADYFYLCRFFWGLQEAWVDKKALDWGKILDFVSKYFRRDKELLLNEAFQSQGKRRDGTSIWIIDAVADLINSGCKKDDERAIPDKCFNEIEQIFEVILPLLKGEEQPDTQGDVLTYVLNSTLGKTIDAYIIFSLRRARISGKKKGDLLQKRYEIFFTLGIDAYIWFGCYLPQMRYLDNKYAEEKIDEFSKKDTGDIGWKNFMEGYLSGARVYKDVYALMRLNYKKALQSNIFKDRIEERLVQHITIGYLQGYELLQEKNTDGEDSLFWKMLMDKEEYKHTRWLEIPDFFWSFTEKTMKKDETVKREPTPEEIKKKILEFWAWTYKNRDLIKTQLGSDYESFLGKMSQLTILLDRIDEDNEKWLLLSAPYIDLHHNATFFIEYLTRFEDAKSIKRIGKIFREVLNGIIPTYQQKDIELIVSRIYEKGVKNDANNICNTYGRRGIHFLRPIWEKYQPQK